MKSFKEFIWETKLPKESPFPPSKYGDHKFTNSDKPKHRMIQHIHDEIQAGRMQKPRKVALSKVVATQRYLANRPQDNANHTFDLFKEHPTHPIYFRDGKNYHIIDGHHRSALAKVTGKTHIHAHVYTWGKKKLAEGERLDALKSAWKAHKRLQSQHVHGSTKSKSKLKRAVRNTAYYGKYAAMAGAQGAALTVATGSAKVGAAMAAGPVVAALGGHAQMVHKKYKSILDRNRRERIHQQVAKALRDKTK